MSWLLLIPSAIKTHKHSFEIIGIFSERFPQDKGFILELFYTGFSPCHLPLSLLELNILSDISDT